jgi:hypothetical protein
MLSYYAIHPKQVLNIRRNAFKIFNEQKTYKILEQRKVLFYLFCVNSYY